MADCKDNAIEAPGGKGLAWRVLTPFTSPLGFPSTRPYGFYKKHHTIWVSHVCCYLYHRLATGTSDRSWLKNTNVVSIKMQAEKREWSWQQNELQRGITTLYMFHSQMLKVMEIICWSEGQIYMINPSGFTSKPRY